MAVNYFPHDYNSRNDPKLLKAQMLLGMAGIGIYWCVVELLYEQKGYIEIANIEHIAFNLHITKEDLEKILFETSLFEKDAFKIWSNSLLKRIDHIARKSSSASHSASARWNERNKNIEKFLPPTPEAVYKEFLNRGLPSKFAKAEADKFIAHFVQTNWKIARKDKLYPMISWTAAVTTWVGNYVKGGGTIREGNAGQMKLNVSKEQQYGKVDYSKLKK